MHPARSMTAALCLPAALATDGSAQSLSYVLVRQRTANEPAYAKTNGVYNLIIETDGQQCTARFPRLRQNERELGGTDEYFVRFPASCALTPAKLARSKILISTGSSDAWLPRSFLVAAYYGLQPLKLVDTTWPATQWFSRDAGDVSAPNTARPTWELPRWVSPPETPGLPRQEICMTARTPDGWIRTDLLYDAAACGGGPAVCANTTVVTQYRDLPVGSELLILPNQPVPAGWTVTVASVPVNEFVDVRGRIRCVTELVRIKRVQ